MSRYGAQHFAKPENALKRAEELIRVGQPSAALQTLHDVISSKRHRVWSKTMERIMFRFVDLAVELKKGRVAKDGLFQYRIISQSVNVASLEEVIKYFLKLSTERAEAAQAKAAEMLEGVADLEEDITPEEIILSYVSSDSDKDRIDREEVTPWFRFLWETYRTTLEVLKNNNKLESLYAMTAQRAFGFCKTYGRITEMRRLCDMLRNHLSNLNKWRDQRDRPELSAPETFSLYMETRFEQLRTSVSLEMWQEAFRTIEDIHGLVVQVRREPKPQHLATYYSMLTKIFYKSGNQLYAAFSWNKLFALSKNHNKMLTPGDLEHLASCVVLSATAVPPFGDKANAAHFELEAEKEQKQRMAALLTLSFTPVKKNTSALTRGALLASVRDGALTSASPLAQSIYRALEETFAPLKLAKQAAPLIEQLADLTPELSPAFPVSDVDLSVLRPKLENLGLLRVLQQVSSVYSTMSITNLLKVVPFPSLTPASVEKTVVKSVRAGFLRVTIDHRKRSLSFGATRLEDASVREQLTDVTRRLAIAVGMIFPEGDWHQTLARRVPAMPAMPLPLLPDGTRAALACLLAAAALLSSARRVLAHRQCSMLALPFVLPLNAVRKALLLGYGLAAMVLSSDKRYKLRPNGGRPAGSELVAKKRVVFVRHGESVWNEMWNKGFMPPGFPYRVGKGLLQEVLLFASRDSVLLDSCLNAKGTRQGRALADFVARTPAEELEVMPERARRDLAALRGGAGVPEGGVVRCSSNLRRAIATACLVAPEAVAEAPMEVLSSLQEISVNVDTLSLTPAGQAPLLEDGVPQPETWGQGGNTGNKALFGRGDARLAAFAAWCAARPEEYVVVGGHSLVFREFFKRYLPAASAFPGKSRKMINCGVVAFDLEVFADGEAFVDEASVEVVYGGFEGGKKKGGLKAQLKKLGMAALCVGAAMALRVVLGPGRHAQVSLPFGL